MEIGEPRTSAFGGESERVKNVSMRLSSFISSLSWDGNYGLGEDFMGYRKALGKEKATQA